MIQLTDIIIPIEEDEESDELKACCSVCREELSISRSNNFKFLPHTLANCMKNITMLLHSLAIKEGLIEVK